MRTTTVAFVKNDSRQNTDEENEGMAIRLRSMHLTHQGESVSRTHRPLLFIVDTLFRARTMCIVNPSPHPSVVDGTGHATGNP
jgi:hypothetical protein